MQQLSGLDTCFLNLESNTAPMHVACLTLIDRGGGDARLEFSTVRNHIESRLHRMPALRRRLLPAPLNLDMPYWIEDPEFDIEQHVRRRVLPAPGGERELNELICEALATRLDRTRPLWEVLFVEGLPGNRVALLSKVHHACVDGLAGADLISHLLDTAPQALKETATVPQIWNPAPTPTPLELYQATAKALVTRPQHSWRLIKESVPLLVSAGRNAMARQHASRLFGDDGGSGLSLAPRTLFNTAIDARRSYATGTVPLSRIRHIKQQLQVTLNDLVLAVSAQALRDYLIERRQLPERPLIAGVPVSTRRRAERDGSGGNRITFARISLATHLADPLRRMRHIQAAMEQHKHDEPVHGSSHGLLGDWAEVPAPVLMMEAARLYEHFCVTNYFSPPFNLIISSVPGSRRPLYFAGHPVLANYPASIPYHGLGFNITVFNDQGALNLGVTAHRRTVPDADRFVEIWMQALEQHADLAERASAATAIDSAESRRRPAASTLARARRRRAEASLAE